MTTLWTPSPRWSGQSVGILLSGPSMNRRVATRLRAACDRVIAVKQAALLAPWADMLVALDAPWPPPFRDFAGERVIGVEQEDLQAWHLGHTHERVTVGQAVLEIRNSGLAAVRIAAALGATRIRVAGFNPEAGRRWHDADADAPHPYPGLREGMEQIGRELAAVGVQLEFAGE